MLFYTFIYFGHKIISLNMKKYKVHNFPTQYNNYIRRKNVKVLRVLKLFNQRNLNFWLFIECNFFLFGNVSQKSTLLQFRLNLVILVRNFTNNNNQQLENKQNWFNNHRSHLAGGHETQCWRSLYRIGCTIIVKNALTIIYFN